MQYSLNTANLDETRGAGNARLIKILTSSKKGEQSKASGLDILPPKELQKETRKCSHCLLKAGSQHSLKVIIAVKCDDSEIRRCVSTTKSYIQNSKIELRSWSIVYHRRQKLYSENKEMPMKYELNKRQEIQYIDVTILRKKGTDKETLY